MLSEALKHWRVTWNPEVSDLIEALGAAQDVTIPELPLKKKERSEKLAQLAKKCSDEQRSAVLAAFEAFARDATGALVWPAVEVLSELDPDPRIGRMALRILSQLQGQLTAKLWRRLVRCVEQHGDARLVALARPYQEALLTQGEGWGFSLERLNNVLKRLEADRPARAANAKLLEKASKLVRASASAPRPDDAAQEAQLIDAIVAAPGDDTPRLVYADFLTERRRPRGEFISLQIARAAQKRTTASAAEKKLLSAHLQDILGPFDGVVAKAKLVIERGFVVEARLDKPLPAHPLTRLLREVDFWRAQFTAGPKLDRLEHATGPEPAAAPALFSAAPNLKSWSVRVYSDARQVVDAVGGASLERLDLELVGGPGTRPVEDTLHRLFETPGGSKLRHVRVAFPFTVTSELKGVKVPKSVETLTLERTHEACATFTRDGQKWRLHVRFESHAGRFHQRVLAGIIGVVPGPFDTTVEHPTWGGGPELTAEIEGLRPVSSSFVVRQSG
ncbi:MAG: TIGR02996 domain-containing protein [Myxococcaceae bacterium]